MASFKGFPGATAAGNGLWSLHNKVDFIFNH